MEAHVSHHLLLYEVVEDYLERRPAYRAEHLAAAAREREAGRLILAGAFGDPPNGAALIFRGVDAEHVRAFAEADPYVRAGLIRSWRVEPYTVVVGAPGLTAAPPD